MLTRKDFRGACFNRRHLLILFLLWLLLLAACGSDATPTPVALAPEVEATDVVAEAATAPPPTATVEPAVADTATPLPTEPPPPTNTPIPTATPVTPTLAPTATTSPTAEPAATLPPTAVPPTVPPPAPAQPTEPPPLPPTEPPPPPPAAPELGVNILPNASFEEGWYHLGGVPELQLPNGWSFDWEEGPTGFGNQPWDVWVRPETRVLPYFQLPENERSLFIRDGDHTIKMFKGNGAISFWLFRDLTLEPGTYVFEINVFPDLVRDYSNGKVWAGDPLSGEVRFILGTGGSDWIFPAFGQWNTLHYTFTLSQPQSIRVGVAFRGRYALANNGWFFDAWSLKRVQN